MTDLYNSKVTIYNDILEDSVNARRFEKHIIDRCSVQGGYVEKTDGTIQNIVNAQTVITKDIEHYKPPVEYKGLPVDIRQNYFTVQVGDFIVLSEVDDIVTTSQEFATLQKKYGNNAGIKVASVTPSINGMQVDNITITNV